MPSHWTVDAHMASDVSQKRATAHARNAFHGPVNRDGDTEKAIIGAVYNCLGCRPHFVSRADFGMPHFGMPHGVNATFHPPAR